MQAGLTEGELENYENKQHPEPRVESELTFWLSPFQPRYELALDLPLPERYCRFWRHCFVFQSRFLFSFLISPSLKHSTSHSPHIPLSLSLCLPVPCESSITCHSFTVPVSIHALDTGPLAPRPLPVDWLFAFAD
jgi:hypothetical protein